LLEIIANQMALIAEIVKVPVNYKHTDPEHLPGREIKIFANPLVFSADTVRRRDGAVKTFCGICNWLI
jgi:hypothetical protein